MRSDTLGGTEMPADCIEEPGCYICNWNGHVLRIPSERGQTRRSMMVSIVGSRPLTVTRVSDDPYIPLSEAQAVARDIQAVSAPAPSAADKSDKATRPRTRRTKNKVGNGKAAGSRRTRKPQTRSRRSSGTPKKHQR